MKRASRLFPYLLIFAVTILLLLPQIVSKSTIIGIDSVFHMNRFYDTAMQMKTGKYNYFLSVFGFQQSARMVNPLYGPLSAYFNGLLLIIGGSWFRYQLLSSTIVLFLSGSSMYHLASRLNIDKFNSLVVAIIYMLSNLVMAWVVGEQFTGWGAALLPLLMISGLDMAKNHRVKILLLAIPMTLLLQTHIMSSLIGACALVPFFLYGFCYSENRKRMFLNAIIAVFITLALNANVWGGMLEFYSNNKLLPVAPQTEMASDSIAFFGKNVFVLNPLYSCIIIFVIAYFIIFWKKITLISHVTFLNGMFFLWISSCLFPWNTFYKLVPGIAYFIQMPRRFSVIAFILLILCFGMIMTETSKLKIVNGIKMILPFVAAILVFLQGSTLIRQGVKAYQSPGVLYNDYNVHYQSYNNNRLRDSLRSRDVEYAIKALTKATPDYLPINYKVTPTNYFDYHPYGNYDDRVINNKLPLKRSVDNKGNLIMEFNNAGDKVQTVELPVIKYHNTQIYVNDKLQNKVKTSHIGSVYLNLQPGASFIKLKYEPARWLTMLLWLTSFSWIILIGYLVIKFGVKGVKYYSKK
ncbi:hypothetical protein [Apilactobacillus xinyiensis]|uniref:hypothetical protein n=1 Tax=Apilactobacillus xinyiensis TaxID=2841032 RepID=UPI00200F9DB8|nr:hypothetical protein [Apilactobacillus xinyiensis]MCL0330400.1 hypothetical protein [Apilactobacillus xinyiensis]